jgi:adenylate cyclase
MYLLEHRERVVSKSELIEQIWTEPYVSDAAFASCLRKVRQAVGDDGKTQYVIQTCRGQGYRLIATVTANSEVHAETKGGMERSSTSHEGALRPVVRMFAERKVVTLLCCAPVASPVHDDMQRLDAVHAHLQALYELIHPAVECYGGWVQTVAGERIVVVFGAPLAQEDHAQRAAHAALDVQQAVSIASRETSVTDERLPPVRLVLHTGNVVVGGVGSGQTTSMTLVGPTETLATILLEHADPGMLICSESTAHCLQHDAGLDLVPVHNTQDAPAGSPLRRLYNLRRADQQPVLGRRSQQRTSQPFVGRVRELSILQALWARVESGQGQLVGIVGAPGMGKSRLLDVFRQRLGAQAYRYVQGQCRSYGTSTPYLPIRDLLSQFVGISEGDASDVIAAKVSRWVHEAGMEAETEAPYFQLVLGVPVSPRRYPVPSPELIKARTFEALVQLILRCSQRGPIVLEVEDLHWSDATSQAWLDALSLRLRGARVLILATYRPGYTPLWLDKSYATQLPLAPLTLYESQELVQALLATDDTSAAYQQYIVAKAAGNPFFLVEWVRALKDQPHPETMDNVPATIQAMLTARIDRLTLEAKAVLQAGAVIGNEAPYAFLAALTTLSDATLRHCLVELQAAEFMVEMHLSEKLVYAFTHVLIQDVTYQSLLKPARQQLHLRMAQCLTAESPMSTAAQPEWIAHQYTEAGCLAQALPYWQQAGQQALQRAAYTESAELFTKALELIAALPNPAAHRPFELDVRIALGQALMASQGYAAPVVGQTYERAWELCRQGGDARQQFFILRGLRRFYDNRGDFVRARQVGERLYELAEQFDDPTYRQEAHYSLGHTLYLLGDITAAYQHLQRGIALVAPEQPHSVIMGLMNRDVAAHCCWLLGYPAQAQVYVREALELAQQQSSPLNVVHALFYAAGIHQYLQNVPAVQALADQLITVATQWKLSYWLTWGILLQGWSLSQQGQPKAAIAALQRCWTRSNAGGSTAFPLASTLLAETYGYLDRIADGLHTLDEGLTRVQQSGEQGRIAELYRLKGEFIRKQGDRQRDRDDAEACFHQALTIAQSQYVKSLELRAAMSLGHLWQQQGRRQEAGELLMPIYHWFTEGFDTADLRKAKALLEAWTRS